MRKITLLFVLVGVLFSFLSFAGSGDLFTYDKAKVESQLTELTALETIVLQDETLTYNDLIEVNNPLVMDLDYNSTMLMSNMSATPVVPPFWWGCLLGPVGVLAVYLIEDDTAQTKSAFWGCLVGAAGYTVFYVGYYFLLLASY